MRGTSHVYSERCNACVTVPGVGTKEYPYPRSNAPHSASSPSATWSASGQLNFPSSNGASPSHAATKESPQYFGTRPLGTLPGSGSNKRPSGASPTLHGAGGGHGASQTAQTPTYDYGRGSSASFPMNPPANTSAYGPAGTGTASTSPAAAYAQSPAGSYSGPTKTSMFAVPAAAAWQPALPVSPWSTQERSAAVLGGSVETETILRSDLKAIKRSRLKAWTWFTMLLLATGGAGYLGVKQHIALMAERDKAKADLSEREQKQARILRNLGISEAEAMNKPAAAPGKVPVMPGKPAAAGASAAPSPRTAKLAEDLKKQLAGVAGLTVEQRGDRVVVSLEQGAIFAPRQFEVGLTGYRVLYRFGKAIKGVKDRHIVVSVPSMELKRGKAWNIAAARSVSLGRFLIDDLSVEPQRVVARVPAPSGGRGRAPHIEFSLESAPETTKS
jgi:hypothetical protein